MSAPLFFGPAMLLPHGCGHAEVEHGLISRCKMAATLANRTAYTLQKRKIAGYLYFPHRKSATDKRVGSVSTVEDGDNQAIGR